LEDNIKKVFQSLSGLKILLFTMQIILSTSIYFNFIFQLYFELLQITLCIYLFIELSIFLKFMEGFLKFPLLRQVYPRENGKEQALSLLQLF
jgi:hypothetical protein